MRDCETCPIRKVNCLSGSCFYDLVATGLRSDFGEGIPVDEVMSCVEILLVECDEVLYDIEIKTPPNYFYTLNDANLWKADYFLYPAHATDCFLIADVEFLNQLKTPSSLFNESKRLELIVARFKQLGFEPQIEFHDEDSKVPVGVSLALGEIGSNTCCGVSVSGSTLNAAIQAWLLKKHDILIGTVMYGSELHNLWNNLVND